MAVYLLISSHSSHMFVLFTCHLLHTSAASSSKQSLAPWGSDLAPPPCKYQHCCCFIRKYSSNYSFPSLFLLPSLLPLPHTNTYTHSTAEHSTAGERVCFLRQEVRADGPQQMLAMTFACFGPWHQYSHNPRPRSWHNPS